MRVGCFSTHHLKGLGSFYLSVQKVATLIPLELGSHRDSLQGHWDY